MTDSLRPFPEGSLSPHFIDVWTVPTDLPTEKLEQLRTLLTPDEAARVDRIRIPAKQREALISRGVLRQLLGMATGENAQTLPLAVGPHGKPFLHSAAHARLKFNVSHTAGRMMVAITVDHEIGVDIETIREDRSHVELAQRFFTQAEAAAITNSPGPLRAHTFFTCWCRKEAILKATGLGIAAGLQTFEVPVGNLPQPVMVHRFDGARQQTWMLQSLAVHAPYVASVATEPCDAVIRQWEIPAT